MLCQCNGCAGYAAWKDANRADFERWLEARQDPRDLSYAEAVAAREAREAAAIERYSAMVVRQSREMDMQVAVANERYARYRSRVAR